MKHIFLVTQVSALTKLGVDVDTFDRNGRTALWYAIAGSQQDGGQACCALLLDAGAKIASQARFDAKSCLC